MQETLTEKYEAGELPVTGPGKGSINPLPTRSEDQRIRASSGLDSEEFNALVKKARDFGSHYGRPFMKAKSNFAQAFKKNVDDFICLRGMFPGQGSHDTRLVANTEYTWATFCPEFLGITSDYFGRLVRKLRPEANSGPPGPKTNDDEGTREVPGNNLDDVFAYFSPLKDVPATFATELRTLILHFGLEQQITVVELSSEKFDN
jgi:hypothetical protein